jgi:hypothetical protein
LIYPVDIKEMPMTQKPTASISPPQYNKRVLFTPQNIALIVMWLLTTTALVLMLLSGVRDNAQFGVERSILQAAYVLTLFWYLIRTGPSVKQLPELRPLLLPQSRLGKLIPVIGLALLFLAELIGLGILMPLLMLATIWILIVWRREIGLPAVLMSLALVAIAFLTGLPFYQNQYIGRANFILLLGFAIPMFVAGGLLAEHTRLLGSQLYTGRYKEALVSFLWGCLLFVPLGLFNAAAGSPGPGMTWVNRWWMPLSQPLFSGIVEEVWFRLFLVSLCYLLLRPAFSKRPVIGLVCAVLFSAITFGLGHGGTLLENLFITGLLYGLPMAVIFARRDWEHAVGAHYMINMIPTLMVFLNI